MNRIFTQAAAQINPLIVEHPLRPLRLAAPRPPGGAGRKRSEEAAEIYWAPCRQTPV
jgi:hypothetical protein